MPKSFSPYLLCLGLLLGLSACRKNNYEGIRGVADYVPLKPGSYWIYTSVTVDDFGNEVVLPGPLPHHPQPDSIYVEKDTLVNGVRYTKVVVPDLPPPMWLLRDSSNYLVDATGQVRLAPNDFISVFYERTWDASMFSPDSVVDVRTRMADWDKLVVTPAGSFRTISLDEVYTFIPYANSGRTASERRRHSRYARGIGMVTETEPFYTGQPYYEERRLVRYHLN